MLTDPYSIYVNKRPIRVAFLIEDKPESLKVINDILAYNRDRWGGRYNPIIITDGQTLSDAWWSLLEAVDPDIIKSFVIISDDLLAIIHRKISPYLILQPDTKIAARRSCIDLPVNGLSILPTMRNIRLMGFGVNESSLILFDIASGKTDPLIKQFIDWNFGGYYCNLNQDISRALNDIHTRTYHVNDAASLLKPFTELSTYNSFTYPIQLCSIPIDAVPEVKFDLVNCYFHVVIGDTPADVAYFWNRPAMIEQWRRSHVNQILLPLNIAKDSQLTESLSMWIQRYVEPIGNQQGSIRFVSLSLAEDELKEVVKPFTNSLKLPYRLDAIKEMPPLKTDEIVRHLNSDKIDLFRVKDTNEHIILHEPDIDYGLSTDRYWMADLYIEARDNYPNIIRNKLFWQLPRVNSLAFQIFKSPSRILRSRYPSVLMTSNNPRIELSLLEDVKILSLIAAPHIRSLDKADARYNKAFGDRIRYAQAPLSEKGRYLSGLIDLFSDLYIASSYLEKRYWRHILDLLSGRMVRKEVERIKVIKNKIKKSFRLNPKQFTLDDETISWLAQYIQTVAYSLPAPSNDLRYFVFEKEAKIETDEYNSIHVEQTPFKFSPDELVSELSFLLERGILLIGIRVGCPSCGYYAWHHIDSVKQNLQCEGCNTIFTIPPEVEWHYRLNSLVRAAYAEHGLLPVILVLGQLLLEARTSFFFSPCLDLFEKGNNYSPIGDLDISVILDGKFIIGEIKQSRNLFDKATFVKMEEIALRIMPDLLIFSSLDRIPNGLIIKEIERLSERLKPFDIDVQWYSLDEFKFNPYPYR